MEVEVAAIVPVKQEEGKELNSDVSHLSHACGACFIKTRHFY